MLLTRLAFSLSLALSLAAVRRVKGQDQTYDDCRQVAGSITSLNLVPYTYEKDYFTADRYFQEFWKEEWSDDYVFSGKEVISEYKVQVVSGPSGREVTLQHRLIGDQKLERSAAPDKVILKIYSKDLDLYYWLNRESVCRGQLPIDYKDIVHVEAYVLGAAGS
jgi:hypothetical protein